jgi:hypothetical protein
MQVDVPPETCVYTVTVMPSIRSRILAAQSQSAATMTGIGHLCDPSLIVPHELHFRRGNGRLSAMRRWRFRIVVEAARLIGVANQRRERRSRHDLWFGLPGIPDACFPAFPGTGWSSRTASRSASSTLTDSHACNMHEPGHRRTGTPRPVGKRERALRCSNHGRRLFGVHACARSVASHGGSA